MVRLTGILVNRDLASKLTNKSNLFQIGQIRSLRQVVKEAIHEVKASTLLFDEYQSEICNMYDEFLLKLC